jgi:hypothetical protein
VQDKKMAYALEKYRPSRRYRTVSEAIRAEELSPRGTWHPYWGIYLELLPDDLAASCFRAMPLMQ